MSKKLFTIFITSITSAIIFCACILASNPSNKKEDVIPVAERPKPQITAIITHHQTMEEVLGEDEDSDEVDMETYEVVSSSTTCSTSSSTPVIVENENPVEEIFIEESVEEETPVSIESSWKSLGVYKVTAYCPCVKCCGKTNGITASGTQATANRTIAASSSIPFGTQIKINGVVYTVEDRGGAIGAGHIDIFFNTHQEALNWGVRNYEVFQYCE